MYEYIAYVGVMKAVCVLGVFVEKWQRCLAPRQPGYITLARARTQSQTLKHLTLLKFYINK